MHLVWRLLILVRNSGTCRALRVGPSKVLKTLQDSELPCHSAFYYAPQIYYTLNPSLRGEIHCKTQGE